MTDQPETEAVATESAVVDPEEFASRELRDPVEHFREAPSPHENMCSGPGEENNVDL